MSDCLFCKIAYGQMGTKFIYEDDLVVVFKDIKPKADTHLLITSKRHIKSLAQATDEDRQLLAHMLIITAKLAKDLEIKGYRIIINTGREGGQEIDHLHYHFLAGKTLVGF